MELNKVHVRTSVSVKVSKKLLRVGLPVLFSFVLLVVLVFFFVRPTFLDKSIVR